MHASGDAQNKIADYSCIESKLLLDRIRMLHPELMWFSCYLKE